MNVKSKKRNKNIITKILYVQIFIVAILMMNTMSALASDINIAFGKPVSITTNGVEVNTDKCAGQWPLDITDGSLDYKPVSSCEEDGVIGWNDAIQNKLMTVRVTIDLQGTYRIKKIRYNPGKVQRAETWTADFMESPFGRIAGNPGTPYNGVWTEQTGDIISSKVDITFEKTNTGWANNWLFIGEIEIYGEKETPTTIPIDKKEDLGPYDLNHKYYIHVYNVDDIAKAFVNNNLIVQKGYQQDSGWIEITNYLSEGKNIIEFNEENGIYDGWTYGFEIRQDDSNIIWKDTCGTSGTKNCNEDYTQGLVYRDIITLTLNPTTSNTNFKFVHITDTHIGYYTFPGGDPEPMSSLGMRESVGRFADTMQDIKSQKPDFIIITGDLVEYNDQYLFMAFINLLKSINIPVYITPGNHDRRDISFVLGNNMYNYNTYIRPINPTSIYGNDYVFDYKGLRFIGLDSGADHNAYIENIPGKNTASYFDGTPESKGLTDDQMKLLRNQFNNNMQKIIFMHGPAIESVNDKEPYPGYLAPDGAPGGNDGTIAFNRQDFINYARDNNVQLVLTGHSHNYPIFDVNGQIVNNDSLNRPLFIQTQSATKDDNKNGNQISYGYRIIDVNNGKVTPYNPTYTRRNTGRNIAKQYVSFNGYPYNVGAYDTQGHYSGISSNCRDIILDIPNSYYTGNYGGGTKIIPQVLVAYTKLKEIKIRPDCSETNVQSKYVTNDESEYNTSFNMSVVSETDESNIEIEYHNVNATIDSIITIDMTNISKNYNTSIDTNNDGIIDKTVAPDYISINVTGDINGDKIVTAADALLYLRYAVGQNISPYNINIYDDVTCENPAKITAADALKVLRKAVGNDVSLGC